MLRAFEANITEKSFFNKGQKLLVAVSGGIDSMVLCYLLLQTGHNFSVAHCNFKLRGIESDDDEKFVKDFCNKNKITFYSRSFDTSEYAESNSISIQMAARELRYNYFKELMENEAMDILLTAHHLNDHIETFFINLLRGSGINGLKGIEEKRNNTVRPLLAFTKEQIQNYAHENHIAFRNDSSNNEDKYVRNFLRLNILPKFKVLNPSFELVMQRELEHLKDYHKILSNHFEKEKKKIVIEEKDSIRIHIDRLKECETPQLILFEILKDYGFNSKEIDKILLSSDSIPGKRFVSANYELVKDRDFMIIKKIVNLNQTTIEIKNDQTQINEPVHLSFKKVNDFVPEKNSAVAYIDASKLQYPLKLRNWQTGDKFRPLGMSGFKKLSDLFVDLKMNQFEKQETLILENGNKDIIWVLNKRMDDRYKITDQTKDILRIEISGK